MCAINHHLLHNIVKFAISYIVSSINRVSNIIVKYKVSIILLLLLYDSYRVYYFQLENTKTFPYLFTIIHVILLCSYKIFGIIRKILLNNANVLYF